MVKATKKPISIKIRSGINKPDKWKAIAKIAEEEGVQMITFHPRTVKQGYSGKADWNLIKELKQLVKIPVVGNGDIETPEDAKRMLDETGCDYVMVGRAASKNPFIFQQINHYLNTGKYRKISDKRRIHAFFKYLDYSQNYKTIKFSSIRMQAMNFTKGMVGGKKVRGDLLHVKTIEDVKEILETNLSLK